MKTISTFHELRLFLSISICLLLTVGALSAQSTFPDKRWQQYKNVEDAGFASEKIALVKQKFEKSDAASLLVVYRGKVLVSYGDNTRKFMVHSIRKSFMNAMIGIEVEKGTLNLNQTLGQMNIDDIGKLTENEKMATLENLLAARSGIYLPSAYSPRGMEKNLPKRGSHKPGTFWYYNNWDFNTLLTIYEKQTGKKFFEAFDREIATPIGMEDFQIGDTYYRTESDKSIHPAYLFRMSARDMARFGLLYLRKGKWNESQLVSPDWISKSTQTVSKDLGAFAHKGTYGLLWWISPKINGKEMYYASGSGGHRIMVFPNDDLVIVHRVNTYDGFTTSDADIGPLISGILDARKNEGVASPKLTNYDPPKKTAKTIYKGSMDEYLGTYKHRALGEMSIKKDKDGYFLQNGVGIFRLYPQSESSFSPEDVESLIVMKKASAENKRFSIVPQFAEDKSLSAVVFFY